MSRLQINKIIFILFFVGITYSFSINSSALTIIKREEMNIDNTIAKQDDNFLQPDSIIIAPIYIDSDDVVSDYDWYQGIYYYQTLRLNQGDFLFHYLITKSGQVFEGALKGEEHRFRLDNETLHPIIVAYMANKSDVEFDELSKASVGELILDIANRNSIDMTSIYTKEIEFATKENQPVLIRFNLLGGRWERSLKEITSSIKDSYKPEARSFDLAITKIELPQSEVNVGDNVVMSITLQNNSDGILLKGNPAEPIMTMNGGTSSKFFQNGVWLGLTQAPIFSDAAFLRPKETKTFQVRLNVPLYFGIQTEKFALTDALGGKYPNTDFDVTLNIRHPDKKVIEIVNTTMRNIHDKPWYSSPTISKATRGQRYLVLEEANGGWLNLDLGGGRTGWIDSVYARQV